MARGFGKDGRALVSSTGMPIPTQHHRQYLMPLTRSPTVKRKGRPSTARATAKSKTEQKLSSMEFESDSTTGNLVAVIEFPPKTTKDTGASEMSRPTAEENEKLVSDKSRLEEKSVRRDRQSSLEVGFSVSSGRDASDASHKNLSEASIREGESEKKQQALAETESGTDTDATVKKLDDNIFTLWGGRSRTPSIDEDRQEVCLCKGGPGKIECGQPVDPSKNGEVGIRCDKCREWYHAPCQMVPKAAVNAVGKYSMIHWFCTSCHVVLFDKKEKEGVNMLADRLKTLEEDSIGKMKDHIKDLEKMVFNHLKLVDRALSNQEETAANHTRMLERTLREQREQKSSYADMVKKSCAQTVSEMTAQLNKMEEQNRPEKAHPKEITEALGSIMDKERRKLNVVVYNLPESEPNEFETREKKDKDQFVGAIQSSLRLNIKVSKCFRAGRIQADRPRLLIVTLNDLETKIELLRMSSQLRSIPEWKSLYIIPDLTLAEREERRKLRQELATRRSAGEENLIIKKGKIIKVTKPAMQNKFLGVQGDRHENNKHVNSSPNANSQEGVANKTADKQQ